MPHSVGVAAMDKHTYLVTNHSSTIGSFGYTLGIFFALRLG